MVSGNIGPLKVRARFWQEAARYNLGVTRVRALTSPSDRFQALKYRHGPILLWAVGWEGPDPTIDGLWRCGMDTEGLGGDLNNIFCFCGERAVTKLCKIGESGF